MAAAAIRPRREQPDRSGKKHEYTQEELSMNKTETKRARRWSYVGFEPDTTCVATKNLPVLGAERQALADMVVGEEDPTYNGRVPAAFSFGERGGCGRGFYCEAGQVHRLGRGTLAWLACEEKGASKSKREQQFYFTLVELVKTELAPTFSRADSKLTVIYYVNGTMIRAYDLDPNSVIPSHLVAAAIWWRVARWTSIDDHTGSASITSFAIPYRLEPGSCTLVHAANVGDRDGAYVAGGLKLNDMRTVESFEPWEDGIPHFLEDNGDLTPAAFADIVPRPYSFFHDNDESAFTFRLVLIVPVPGCAVPIIIEEPKEDHLSEDFL